MLMQSELNENGLEVGRELSKRFPIASKEESVVVYFDFSVQVWNEKERE